MIIVLEAPRGIPLTKVARNSRFHRFRPANLDHPPAEWELLIAIVG
jgi:hypothetical protein